MNKRMNRFFTLSAVVLFLSLSLTVCDNLLEPPPAPKTENGKGLVLFQFGPAGSRTAMPVTYEFSSFLVTLTPLGTQNGGNDVEITNAGPNPYELEVGDWSVAAVIYATGSTSTVIATGTADDVTVSSATPATVTIKLTFTSLTGTGTLHYDITYTDTNTTSTPIVPDDVKMSFSVLSGGPAPTAPTLSLSAATGNIATNAGYYLVRVTLKDTAEAQEAVKAEIVHIYPEQTTELLLSFADTDFHEIIVTADTPITAGALGVTAPVRAATPVTTAVTGTGYSSGAIAWYPGETGGTQLVTGDTFAAGTVYRAEFTLTAESGYTFDGIIANSFTHSTGTVTHPAGSTADTLAITVVFPATALTPIAAGALGVTAPVRAATPVTTAVTGTGYSSGAIAWYPGETGGTQLVTGDTFAANTVYRAEFTLTATTGYTFTGFTGTWTVTGAPTATVTPGTPTATSLTITVVFPATAQAGTATITFTVTDLGNMDIGGSGATISGTDTLTLSADISGISFTPPTDTLTWYVDGEAPTVGNGGDEFIINAANYTEGGHTVRLVINVGGVPYSSQEAAFTVDP